MFKPAALAASLCLLAVTTAARAQEDRLRGFHAGLTAGLNAVDIRNPYDFPDPQIDAVTHTGVSVGVLAGYHFDNTFGIRTGLLYTRLGRMAQETFRLEGGAVDVEKTVDLDYVQIPLLLRMTIAQTLTGFYVQAGLVYSLLQNARVVRNGTTQNDDRLFSRREIGFLVEFGPSYAVSDRFYLTLGLRGYLGFTDLNHEDLETTGLLVGKSQNVAGGLHLTLNYLLPHRN